MELFKHCYLALPEMILALTVCAALLGDLFLGRRYSSIALYISVLGLVLAGTASYLFIGQFSTVLFHGLFVSDDLANLMNVFIALTVLLSFIYSDHYLRERSMPAADYYVLGLCSTLGMMLLVSAHSLLTLYLGLELVALPLYAMTGLWRSSHDGSEAAMKYIVMGAIASGLLLYGFSLLYGATGQLDLQAIAQSLHEHGAQHTGFISFALVFMIAGLGFKLAAVPFHMWVPDVYAGAPTSVTLFIGCAPKIAALAMLIRLLNFGCADVILQWQPMILVLAVLSAGFGNILAIAQKNIKRLFAYSAISHMGYALFGVLAGTTDGYSAALYYVLIYALMTAAALGLLVIMSRNGTEITGIDDLKGLHKRNPWLALMMMITLLSMAGIPPTVGFFTKLWVLKALVDSNMTVVAVLGLLFAVMGAFYYLRLIKNMYFEDPIETTRLVFPHGITAIFSAHCLSLLLLGIFPGALVAVCMTAFH